MTSTSTSTHLRTITAPPCSPANTGMRNLFSQLDQVGVRDLKRKHVILTGGERNTESRCRSTATGIIIDQAPCCRRPTISSSEYSKDETESTDTEMIGVVSDCSGSITSTATSSGGASSCFLLHEACRLFPKTVFIVKSALDADPDSILLHLTNDDSKPNLKTLSSWRVERRYSLPINIAIQHDASIEVLKVLVSRAPEALVKQDGTAHGGSLSVALVHGRDLSVIRLLVAANPLCIHMLDQKRNSPLHLACMYGATLHVVQELYQAFPWALYTRNFHGETPLDIAQRNSIVCSQDVSNFLLRCSANEDHHPTDLLGETVDGGCISDGTMRDIMGSFI